MKKTVIGILAHVDSGKTTLSESILYGTGVIRSLGRVDHGSSYLDTDRLERERGITIFSGQASFTREDIEFTLLDTPGHIDFSPEMERTLRVLDSAILVISGSDGVQSHTETLARLLALYDIPTFIFINKMDISPFTRDELLSSVRGVFGDGCLDFSRCDSADFCEALAMCDEELMNTYLSGEPFDDNAIIRAIKARRVFPCRFGSALRSDGVEGLLDLLCRFATIPEPREELGARVFKITADESGERLTHLKLTGGRLRVRDTLTGRSQNGREWGEKITGLRLYSGAKYKSVSEVSVGGLVAVAGLSATYPGAGLGFEPDSGSSYLEPVLSYRLVLPPEVDVHTAYLKLARLGEEEPQLHISYSQALGEMTFRIMGEVQLEVLRRIILERYGMEVDFIDGGITYRETIAEPVIGVGHYEPLRHYAEVQLLLEPLPRGSGLRFASDVSENQLDLNWQRLVLTHIREREHIGVLTGSPITDMRITLIAGRAHLKHTEGGDFRQATYRAVRHGLMRAKSVLLEPWYDFVFDIPSENLGRVMTDITNMGGSFEPPELDSDSARLTGSAPVSELRGYHRELIGFTKGRGKLALTHGGYRECHDTDEVIAAFGYEAEHDVENTADSVFCSHGAGVVVGWRDVDSHKHLDPGVTLGEDEPEEVAERVDSYMKAVATDAELMAIFERTYGPIKRRISEPGVAPKKPARKPSVSAQSRPAKPQRSYMGREYLLIDGYNIIFAWDDLRALSEKSLDLAREELINRMCSYHGFKKCEVIVVFDAYRVKNNPGEMEHRSGITVVYTREAETADSYIEKASHELASKDHRVRVATSDAQEQLIILGNGAIRVPASALRAELDTVEREIREFILTRR